MASRTTSTATFTRILFESDVSEALVALQECLSTGQFDQAIEWLTAWQDLVDASSSPLNPLLDSLQEDDPQVVSMAIQVLNQLVSSAPDPSHQSRIKNELKELKFEQLLGQVSVRWAKIAEIKKEIDTWFSGEEAGENCLKMISGRDVPAKDIQEEADDVESVLSDLRGMLGDNSLPKEQRVRAVLGLLDTLKNPQDAEQTLLGGPDKKKAPPSSVGPPMAPPPPPRLGPPGPTAMPPPPPPPPNFGKGPPPPPPPMGLAKPAPAELPPCMKPKKIPDKDVKMKTLMWSKLPLSALTNEGKESVWGQLATETRGFSLDFEVIEGMFSLSSTPTNNGDLSSPAVNFKKKDTLVDLLTPKRSQNVTIALKRFKNLEDVLINIRDGNFEAFELEMLRALKGILPDEEEVDALTRYTGDVSLLSPACSFFLQILSIPEYRLRIDCMSYRLEFCSTMDEILPQLTAVNTASLEILNSHSLKRLLLLLVNIGNYLNGATAHGNAAGFKLNSLWKMIDLKAAKGGASLLHALAKMDGNLLKELQTELATVKRASEVSLEEAKGNLRQLTEQAKKLKKDVVVGKTKGYFMEMAAYLEEVVEKELTEAQDMLTTLAQRQEQLAAYFCENKNTFKAEECFKIFSNFISRLQVAVQENEERSQREAAKKTTKQSSSNESVQTGRVETPAEERLFATLEKALPAKVSRRRSSLRTALECSRERDVEAESKLRRWRVKTEEEEEKSPDETSPTDTPRVIRRPRRSPTEGASTLTDFMERLQATSFGRAPLPVSSPVVEENISVTIPSESDGCTSTPGTSPKSSDEGFESEKDKETDAQRGTPRSNQQAPQPESSTAGRRTIPLKDSKTPRLVSITTTGSPPNPATRSSLPRPTQLAKPRVIPSRISQPVKPAKTESPSSLLPKTRTLPRPTTNTTLVKKPPTRLPPPVSVAAKSPMQRRSAPLVPPSKSLPKPVAAPRKAFPSKSLPLTKTAEMTTKPPPVSTSARPSLIKTGSLSQRPSLKGLEAVEKPRPLKKTSNTTSTIKPKWV